MGGIWWLIKKMCQNHFACCLGHEEDEIVAGNERVFPDEDQDMDGQDDGEDQDANMDGQDDGDGDGDEDYPELIDEVPT